MTHHDFWLRKSEKIFSHEIHFFTSKPNGKPTHVMCHSDIFISNLDSFDSSTRPHCTSNPISHVCRFMESKKIICFWFPRSNESNNSLDSINRKLTAHIGYIQNVDHFIRTIDIHFVSSCTSGCVIFCITIITKMKNCYDSTSFRVFYPWVYGLSTYIHCAISETHFKL